MKKIPDNAKMVFKGTIFDVYQWEQELFDGTFSTFEAIKKRDSVTVVATFENCIILNKEEQPGKPPFIALPGGMCEGETDPLFDAKRELQEETGLVSDDWTAWFTSDPWKASKVDWNNYFFIAKNCKKVTEQKLDGGERIEVTKISFEEFLKLPSQASARNKDIFPILEKAASSETEKQKLKDLLGITT